MNTETLSNKSRNELNGSLLDLYRKLTINVGPLPEKEQTKGESTMNPQKEETDEQTLQDEENEISPAIGIGI